MIMCIVLSPLNLPEDYTSIKLDEFKYRILGPYMDFPGNFFDGLLISDVSLYGCDLRNVVLKVPFLME